SWATASLPLAGVLPASSSILSAFTSMPRDLKYAGPSTIETRSVEPLLPKATRTARGSKNIDPIPTIGDCLPFEDEVLPEVALRAFSTIEGPPCGNNEISKKDKAGIGASGLRPPCALRLFGLAQTL